jgi:hypothetical protein
MQFVNDLIGQFDSGPGLVGPSKLARIYKLRWSMWTFGLKSRGGVRKRTLIINKECVGIPFTYARHVADKVAVGFVAEIVLGIPDADGNFLMVVCPHAKNCSSFLELPTDGIPPWKWRGH